MNFIRLSDQPPGHSMLHLPFLPFVFTLGVAGLWALVENLGNLLPSGYSAYQIVWVRYAVHLIFLVLIWLPRRKKSLVRTRRWKDQILRGLLMLGMPVCFILAVRTLPVDNAWSIFWLSPLLAMALSSVFLKEHSPKRIWIAAGIAFAASVVVMHPSLSASLSGVVLALGMTACFSLYLIRTRVLAQEDTLTSLFYTAATVCLPLTALMPFVWKELTINALIIMILIGVAGFGLLFALDRTMETTRIGRVAPILIIEPVLYSLMNSVLFQTPIHPKDIAAGVIILGVSIWAYFSTLNPTFQPLPNPTIASQS